LLAKTVFQDPQPERPPFARANHPRFQVTFGYLG
jgi:hypothetical protein